MEKRTRPGAGIGCRQGNLFSSSNTLSNTEPAGSSVLFKAILAAFLPKRKNEFLHVILGSLQALLK